MGLIPKMHNNNNRPKADLIVAGASELITCAPCGNDPLGRIAGGSVAVQGERIVAVGSTADVAARVDGSTAKVIDASGRVVAPGFVDCHTHLVFGGSRAREYAARLTRSAREVAEMGLPTGIRATVAMTRAATADELFYSALARLDRMFRRGSTTVECKSGYGLSREHELRLLHTARRLSEYHPADIVSTFMGAHDFPPDMDRTAYVDLLVDELIPLAARDGLAEFCDIYCDEGYYTVKETRRVLEAGAAAGLKLKVHADAYSATSVTEVAAELGAVSVEHLNYTSREQMKKLADAGVIGVVVPALDFSVAHPRPYDARAMLEQGMTLALATNLNPACWVESMRFVMMLGCRRHRMTPEEAMAAATVGAARALCREGKIGSLETGKLADIQLWDVPTLEDALYRLDHNPVATVIKKGRVSFIAEEQETM